MKLSFHGAARSVTGSRHILAVDGQRFLLDCGLAQGHDARFEHNRLDFDARSIDAVILSHAHIDHSGALPLLVQRGFTGPIYGTAATVDLARVMLEDSAALQEEQAAEANVRQGLSGFAAHSALYGPEDAMQASRQFVAKPYGIPFEVGSGANVTFRDAGHILGSAFVQMDLREHARQERFVFSGDIGRATLPIIRPPDPPEYADTLVMESTYGDKDHPHIADVEQVLGKLVSQVAAIGGKILIPAFAIGRIQQLTYLLNNLWNKGEIPEIPVFVDSPLAMKATQVFRQHSELWRNSMVNSLQRDHDPDPFGFEMLRYITSAESSRELNQQVDAAIIIAASGMCEGGRIVRHLAHHLEDPRNVVLLVGYQAEGTLGRRLLNGETHFTLQERSVIRRATILHMSGLSAHAGRTELHAFYERYKAHNKNLFIVHGEPASSEALAGWAALQSGARVAVPSHGQQFDF